MEPGVVEHIHLAAEVGAPTYAVPSVDAVAGEGLVGDRKYGAATAQRRPGVGLDLTLVEAEAIEAVLADSGIELAPGETRRNVTTRGVALSDLVGRRFYVGDVLCEGVRLCEPCEYLQAKLGKPLVKAMIHRAGLRANLLGSGPIRVGDSVRLA